MDLGPAFLANHLFALCTNHPVVQHRYGKTTENRRRNLAKNETHRQPLKNWIKEHNRTSNDHSRCSKKHRPEAQNPSTHNGLSKR